MIEPAQLLQHLGVILVEHEDMLVRFDGKKPLLFEFEDVADLEPDISLGKWARGVAKNTPEILEALIKLLHLLVDDAKPKEDLVSLFKLGIHFKDRQKGLFGILKRSVAFVEYANTIPEIRVLLLEMLCVNERMLIGRIGLGQIVQHQKAVTESAPHVAILLIGTEHAMVTFDGFVILFSSAVDSTHLDKRTDIVRVVSKHVLIGEERLVQVVHQLAHTSKLEPRGLVRCSESLLDRRNG